LGPIGLGISIAIIGVAALIFACQHKEYIKDNAISFLKTSFAWFISVGFFLGSGFAFAVKALQLLATIPAISWSIAVPLTVNPIIFVTIVGAIFVKQLLCDVGYHLACAAIGWYKGEEAWPDERQSHLALARDGFLNIIMTSGLLLGLLVKLFIPFIIGFGVAAAIPFWVPIVAPVIALLGLGIKLNKYHQEHPENSWITRPNILIASGVALGFEAGAFIPYVIGAALTMTTPYLLPALLVVSAALVLIGAAIKLSRHIKSNKNTAYLDAGNKVKTSKLGIFNQSGKKAANDNETVEDETNALIPPKEAMEQQ
jgi:hypothetical protein